MLRKSALSLILLLSNPLLAESVEKENAPQIQEESKEQNLESSQTIGASTLVYMSFGIVLGLLYVKTDQWVRSLGNQQPH